MLVWGVQRSYHYALVTSGIFSGIISCGMGGAVLFVIERDPKTQRLINSGVML
jgi:hypothetical protein